MSETTPNYGRNPPDAERAERLRMEAMALRHVFTLDPNERAEAAEALPTYELVLTAKDLAAAFRSAPGMQLPDLAALLKRTALGAEAADLAEAAADILDPAKGQDPQDGAAAYKAVLAGANDAADLQRIREAAKLLERAKAAKNPKARRQDMEAAVRSMEAAERADAPPAFSVERLMEETRNLPEGKPTGWNKVDAAEVRLLPGELTICAARTGHGKTAFLVNLLWNWLKMPPEEDQLFILYEAEEPEQRIFHRLMALACGLAVNEVRDFLRKGKNARDRWTLTPTPAIEKGKAALLELENRLQVVYRPDWNAEDIAAHARKVARQRPLGGVFVDYLQRLPPVDAMARRDLEVSAAGRAFKHLSVRVAAPVVCAAQINRSSVPEKYNQELNACKDFEEAKDVIRGGRPDANNLREGGSEQEADLVLGLLNYAADYKHDAGHLPLAKATPFDVGILKNRYGAVGRWIELTFDGRRGAIEEAAEPTPWNPKLLGEE